MENPIGNPKCTAYKQSIITYSKSEEASYTSFLSMKAKPTYAKNYVSSRIDGGPRLVLGTSGLGGVWGPVNEDESVKAILSALENEEFSRSILRLPTPTQRLS